MAVVVQLPVTPATRADAAALEDAMEAVMVAELVASPVWSMARP